MFIMSITQKASKKTTVTSKRGRPMNIYLHPQDEKIIAALRSVLAQEGLRASDSQILKAALRYVQQDDVEFMYAFFDAQRQDQRFKPK